MKTSLQLTLPVALTLAVLSACNPLSSQSPAAPRLNAASIATPSSGETLVPGRVLVKFKATRGGAQHEALLRQYGLQRARAAVATPAGAAEAAVARHLRVLYGESI